MYENEWRDEKIIDNNDEDKEKTKEKRTKGKIRTKEIKRTSKRRTSRNAIGTLRTSGRTWATWWSTSNTFRSTWTWITKKLSCNERYNNKLKDTLENKYPFLKLLNRQQIQKMSAMFESTGQI